MYEIDCTIFHDLFKTMIEHFGAWRLIERTEEEIYRLVSVLSGGVYRLNICRDGTQLAHLVELTITTKTTGSDAP